MARQIVPDQEWLTLDQAAIYLGVSKRGMNYAIDLKKRNVANKDLVTKTFGNRTLINRNSLDAIDKIYTNEKHLQFA